MKRACVSLIMIIFFISLSSANFLTGNLSHSIANSYGPGGNIKGWVNISLDKESANSLLESSSGESISLSNLLKKISNADFIYNCIPQACTSNYFENNPDTSKIFSLGENESVLIGFKITSGRKLVKDVSGFSLELKSNNPETEKFPLSIDILNDRQIEWNAYVASENFGPENFGCFVIANSSQLIGQIPYCEKISLSKTPEVEIGSYVNGTGTADFEMSIKRADGTEYKKICTATATRSGRIACTPSEFTVNRNGDYFVCIKAKSSDDSGKYRIDSEQKNPCGFTGEYENLYDYDFEIFVRSKKYASSINFTLNDTELIKTGSPETNAEGYIENYLADMYSNNCSEGCIIPVKIYSGVNQEINISSASLFYTADTFAETNSIYDIQETPAEISAGFQKLYLDDAGFHAPNEYGNYTFSLKLNDKELFSNQISVGEVPTIQSLTPTQTAIKYPTKFTVDASSGKNITGYSWDFGDGNTESTTTNFVTHTYDEIGEYILKINVHDSDGKTASKEFNVSVGSASEIIPTLLGKAEANLKEVQKQITNFTQFEQKSVNKVLDIDNLESSITHLKDDFSKASSEEDYETILGKLLETKIPLTVAKTVTSEGLVFYPKKENINLDILKKISRGNYDTGKEDLYKNAILEWDEENANILITYSEISSIYEGYEEPTLRVFNISITKRGTENAYLIIKNMENLFFKEDYSEKKEGDYIYVDIKDSRNVVFSTTEEIDFVNLPAFVSPAINKLSLVEWSPFEKEGGLKRWILFVIIVIFILLGATGAWIILQIWYKRKYENYLFKDRNNLYNLVNFIEAEKEKGTDEKEIISKLKKSGWSSEQLRYALRKYKGKSTGLPEIIPIEKILAGLKELKMKKNQVPRKT